MDQRRLSDEFHGGGIELTSEEVDLTLVNVDVSHNESQFGGGLRVAAGADTEVVISESVFGQNEGFTAGGAISCLGAATIRFRQTNAVALNTGLDGAGIHSDGCTIRREGPLTLWQNSADEYGGGVLVENGGRFVDDPDAQFPASVVNATGNSAGEGGGAFGAIGGGSSLTLKSAQIKGNDAEFGGALVLLDGATASLAGGEQAALCAQNESIHGGSCVGIYSGSALALSGAEVRGNVSAGGDAAIDVGDGGFLFSESVCCATTVGCSSSVMPPPVSCAF